MAKRYVKIESDPLNMERDEIQAILGDQKMSVIIRSLLMWEVNKAKETTPERRTLRGLWYQAIKPALDRIGALKPGFYKSGKVPKLDKLLSRHLAELVRMGITTYLDVGIIDGSRQRRPPLDTHHPLKKAQLVKAQALPVILFIEKDPAYSVIQNLASFYGIAALSGSGEENAE